MKYFVSILVLSLFGVNAFAAQERLAMSNKIMSAPRYTASIKQLGGMNIIANPNGMDNNNTMQIVTGTNQETPEEPEKPEVDQREAERNACINNNIGINMMILSEHYCFLFLCFFLLGFAVIRFA